MSRSRCHASIPVALAVARRLCLARGGLPGARGLRPDGHPLRRAPEPQRILLWEGFDGHPLRKDWHEPYYEEDGKPFDSRWPDGQLRLRRRANPFGRNVQFPADLDPRAWRAVDGEAGRCMARWPRSATDRGWLKTDHIVINMGPQHPSTHGVFRMVVDAGWRDDRQPEAGDGLPAPQPREDRRAQHLPAEHAVHRPARLHLLDEQQLRLRAGGREADGRASRPSAPSTSA